MKTGIKVSDAMTQHPVTVLVDSNLEECAKMMSDKHVGALLIKECDNIVGIITEQDIVRKAVIKNMKPSETKASDIMETNLAKINPNEDVRKALKLMNSMNIRHLPVFDNEEFVGLLTTKDILKIEPQLFELLAAKIELKEQERKPINNIYENEGICESCGNYATVLYKQEGTHVCSRCRD